MRDFERRFEMRTNTSLRIDTRQKEVSSPKAKASDTLQASKENAKDSSSSSPQSPRKKPSKVKKSVTFSEEPTRKEQLKAKKVTPRQSRSNKAFRLPRWAREVPESERRKQIERTCYSPSDYCLDLARVHNDRRCHTAASRCYLAALEYTPGDRRIHSAFKTSLTFVRNNRPYFVPKTSHLRQH